MANDRTTGCMVRFTAVWTLFWVIVASIILWTIAPPNACDQRTRSGVAGLALK